MNYQSVLQFTANSITDFDRLVSLETRLIEKLEDVAVVGGHDFGSDKFNIFVLTNERKATFTEAHRIILDEAIPKELRSAYREASGEDYFILWPLTLTEFNWSGTMSVARIYRKLLNGPLVFLT